MGSDASAPSGVPRPAADLMVQGLAALHRLSDGDSAVTAAALERYAAMKPAVDSLLEGAGRTYLALAVEVLRNNKAVPALMIITEWTVLLVPQTRRRAAPLMLPRISLHATVTQDGADPVLDLHADGKRARVMLPPGPRMQYEVLRLLYRVPPAPRRA